MFMLFADAHPGKDEEEEEREHPAVEPAPMG
jgi:hypothetical protein